MSAGNYLRSGSMKMAACFGNKLKRLSHNPFLMRLSYFLSVSVLGFLALRSASPRSSSPTDLDYFFTSVSATTVSSMSLVDTEVFSDLQLLIIVVLMFSGGEVFTSLIGLQLRLLRWRRVPGETGKFAFLEIEMKANNAGDDIVDGSALGMRPSAEDHKKLVLKSVKCLALVVFGYLLAVHVTGFALVFLYLRLVASARGVLIAKGISIVTFSVFLPVSTFANCGFAPTNENMAVFKRNSGLLLVLIPLGLLGNTLYPPCLRAVIWVLGKLSKQPEYGHILKYHNVIGYDHLLPSLHSILLAVTVLGFILLQFVLFSAMEWGSHVTADLNTYQKTVATFFQAASTRHFGENAFELPSVSTAVLVLFVVMMYLPPYTTWFSPNEAGGISQPMKRKSKSSLMDYLLVSPLSCLAFFVILVCILERDNLQKDPLNFNFLNITIEVISAYGNVGYSMGYSCNLRLDTTGPCKDAGYGFVGRWSVAGKIALIFVMFFGRMKKFFLPAARPGNCPSHLETSK